jgi:hypothetical protein
MIRPAVLGGLLLGLTIWAMTLHVPGALGIGSIELKTRFVAITGGSVAVYLLAVVMLLRRRWPDRALWIVLLVAAGLRLPLIFAPAFLSTDVYRYVWDGRVQAAGFNPYRYMPADPVLASLRDGLVYPKINRADYAPTIYAPAAQIIFAAVGTVWSSVAAVKATMVGFEVLAVICLLRLLRAAELPAERVLIYAWNPLPVWAFAGNGHIDAAAVGLLSVALLLRVRQRMGLAGIALGCAILTKFLPAVVAPALWQRRTGWRSAMAAVATIGVLYAVYSGAGWRVFGFLGGYDAEEGYSGAGGGFWLLAGIGRLVALPDGSALVYKAIVVVILGLLGCWIAFVRRPDDPVAICGSAGAMMAVLTFAISPHYPWYFAWLAVPAVLAPAPVLIWLSAAPMLMYLDTFGDRLVWPSVVFVPAILLALLSVGLNRAGRRPRLVI